MSELTMNTAMDALVFGDFQIPHSENNEYLTLQFSPSFGPRQKRWRNYGLSADFLGDYFAAFFPGTALPDSAINQQDTVKGAISYIANELLENAIKYTDESLVTPISISLYLQEDLITFRVVNHANESTANSYIDFVQRIITAEDIDALYTAQLEKAALGEGQSSMGLLTMIGDYQAQFAWRFTPDPSHHGAMVVDVLAYLKV
ncbi:MAG: ATP-binding protein [Cyanobacteria bacterium]|nr:ATP-binding protein [Cyanobacteriota bacterium]